MSTTRINDEPLTIAEYAILTESGDQAQNYRDALGLFEFAERLGVEGVWVRQFHLKHEQIQRGLPSPLVFLAALAARTMRLRLGTAAITLPLESPLRVAEDAAVLDALSNGRLELGLANGAAPGIPQLYGRPSYSEIEERKRAYLADLSLLTGKPLNLSGVRLNPPAHHLASRIWEATLSARSGREAGERGNGVLIGTTQTTPAQVTARAYYDGLEHYRSRRGVIAPRLGLATLIYAAKDRETALREARAGIHEKYEWGKDFLPAATTLAEMAAAINLHYGTSEQIAQSILEQPGFPFATQLLVQTELFYDSYAQRMDALEQFVNEVAPAVGWCPNPITEGVTL